MEILGRTTRLPESPLEWLLLAILLCVLLVSARLVAGTPTALMGLTTAIVAYLFDARIFIPAALAIGAWLALMALGATQKPKSPRVVARESSYLFGGFALYEVARHLVEGSWQEAVSDGQGWLAFERSIGLDLEQSLQQRIIDSSLQLTAVNSIYSWAFLSIVVGAVYWCFIVNERNYRLFRNSLGISCIFAVLIMALHPMAPPRLLPGSGIVGTHAMVGGSHSFVNEFAALPSLHVGWLALTGVILFWTVQSKWRWFWLFVPVSVMQLTVMATGHHYFLDGVVGSAIAVVPAIMMRRSSNAAVSERGVTRSPVGVTGWINATAKEIADQPKVKLSFYGLGLLLVYLLARQVVDPGFTHYWGYQIFQISATLVFLLAVSVHFSPEGGLSWLTHVIIVLTTWADSLGTAGHMYDRHASYDKITHYMGCMAAACLVCDLLFAMNRRGTLHRPPLQIVAFSATVAVALGIGWEIYEYYGDKLFDTGRFAGQEDTTYDIISDTVGALFGAVIVGLINVKAADSTEVTTPSMQAAENLLRTD